MPKSREAKQKLERNPNCSFCGTHKDDVPLMIISTITDARMCSWCALAQIQQTFGHMMNMEQMIRQAQNPTLPPRVILSGNKEVDAAIRKAKERSK